LTKFLIGTGGWSYFKVPHGDPLSVYSRAFNFVEVNSTFYEIPKLESVKSWRRKVPADFTFSVRCNQILTHKLGFEPVRESYEIYEKMEKICEILKSEFIYFQTPASFHYTKNNVKKIQDFFSSINSKTIRPVLESRDSEPLTENFVDTLKELDIVHCVDILKEVEPCYKSDVIYTRLFGKGYHNIYQPLDSELENVYRTCSREGTKKAVIVSHSNRMFKDAARFKIYKETGEFPQVTRSTGVESIIEVLSEDTIFPVTKKDLVDQQGWKLFDLLSHKRAHIADVLNDLSEKTYYGIRDIIQELGGKAIGEK